MKGTAFFRKDWFLGLVTVLAIFTLYKTTTVFEQIENRLYDSAVASNTRTPSDKIAFVAIDEASIESIGRWPWSREVHAQFLDKLSAGNPKTIAYTVFFTEPSKDPGAAYIDKLAGLYESAKGQSLASHPAQATIDQMGDVIGQAQVQLDTDKQLAAAIKKAGNVQLGMFLELGEPRGNPDKALPPYAQAASVPAQSNLRMTRAVALPIDVLGSVAQGVGHLTVDDDIGGSARAAPLFLNYFDRAFPHLALTASAGFLNIPISQVGLKGDDITLGRNNLPSDGFGKVLPHFYAPVNGKPAFAIDSFIDVFNGKVPASKFAGKLVIVGPTAGGATSTMNTPIGLVAPGEYMAHVTSSLLQGDVYFQPGWGTVASLVALLLVAAYLIVLLPRLSAGLGAAATAGIVVALLALEWFLLTGKMQWVPLVLPVMVAVIGHLVLTTKRFLVTERGKARSDTESAESNRMLGLAFQSQGQLDMAFDKFRRVPMDNAIMENLYNLALDFERKRQFNKAQSVYEYMSAYNPKFRDLEDRRNRAKTMSETVILGGSQTRTNASILTGMAGSEKPMLGRYEVEKELGKGAMGVVYLGKDPKIGRVVAIKTMALSQEFEADELTEVRERFFREAETAGRLAHPHIVTIYDAGEEHDLAYIAMEFLKGKDLVDVTKPDALLPIPLVASIIARVAEALAYAHRNNVIHRDVKPANVMYELTSDTVKVTDFGIARITDSSKTKTGMVLGTPSYMSPEQLSGVRVDGRSDLFSLGVSLFQMLTGRLPFVGDSMAQLMYKIANEPTPDPRLLNSAIPATLVAVVMRATAKDVNQRYQTGDEFAADLRAFLNGTSAPVAAPVPLVAPVVAASVMPAPVPAAVSGSSPAEFDKTQPLSSAVPKPAPSMDFDKTMPFVSAPQSSGDDTDYEKTQPYFPDKHQ